MGQIKKLFNREVFIAIIISAIAFIFVSNVWQSMWIVFSLSVVIGLLWLTSLWQKKYQLRHTLLITLTVLYSVTVVTSVIAATKIIRFDIRFLSDLFFSSEMSVPAGVMVYAVSFLITDLISEVYGKKQAEMAVCLGFISMLIFSLYSLLMVWWQPASYWQGQEMYESVVGLSFRITTAGWVSFLISQYWDVVIFHRLKRKKEKIYGENNQKLPSLWSRNIVSTITSQFIDSTFFISIAFIGIYEDKMVISMIFAQWIIKCIIALIDTPFAYWGRSILIKDEKYENNETEG